MQYSDKELIALLNKVKTIAIVGAVDKPNRPVNGVAREMIAMGYNIIPVHPNRKDVWGLKTYKSIKEIPIPVDIIDVFRHADACPLHAQEALEMSPSPGCFWMQSGISSSEARDILHKSGITVVENRCLKVELRRLGMRQ
ncbi:CoA-binding protein [Pseudodesulfovibrio piezophilus]|uniref:CoA-binding domain protein n=1 Tax=Pseudodesulfovibrio piezophilus (strain DSM 21447 / JCM 15486 / C1TLV30) TaxID=1322246 RepID=M1WJ97_PSEP2|nr:CoA-binding protein [Pseudodesulfovibrio piezophilus]CCH47516.1 CoA-binding domain protein [Pseudodesulfovibrio piezophilus C1TLV30]